ncbi:MAG TPA: GNAT family N-acetyltransferase [Fimbriimonadaceae bacterium]|nr:GNAT family N-acetyltransferase [Fimbriimonadaceae bacterium]
MEIRVLQTSDSPAFYELRLLGLQESPDAFGSTHEEASQTPAEEWARRCEPTADKFILGAFDDRLVGIVGLIREQRSKSRHTAFVWGMNVAPEARGRGIGRSLIRRLIEMARAMPGLEQVHLDVIPAAGPARDLYVSEGFETIALQPKALKVGEKYFDSEHMVLWLD